MLLRLVCDLKYVLRYKIRLISAITITVIAGILSLASCRGITVAWYFLKRPPFTVPLLLLIVLHVAASALFGLLWCCVSFTSRKGCDRHFRCALAFAVYLFWLPLAIMSRLSFLSVLSVVASIFCLVTAVWGLRRVRLLTACVVVALLVLMTYFVYISLGATVGI